MTERTTDHATSNPARISDYIPMLDAVVKQIEKTWAPEIKTYCANSVEWSGRGERLVRRTVPAHLSADATIKPRTAKVRLYLSA